MMKYKHLYFIAFITLTMQGCANWIFRIDVPQGNFLEQKDVDKLRVGMTKEQVIFVLGRPVVKDSFDRDTWYYVYEIKRGQKKNGEDFRSTLIINYEDGLVASLEGDFDEPEDFNTPLDEL